MFYELKVFPNLRARKMPLRQHATKLFQTWDTYDFYVKLVRCVKWTRYIHGHFTYMYFIAASQLDPNISFVLVCKRV